MNSWWGKFGQLASLDNYELINNHNQFLRLITNDKINTKAIHIINNGCVELRYNHDIDYDIEAEFGSEITASFSTANAMIRLMSMLHWLDPSQLLYCDTDSIYFIYGEDNPLHKYPSNDAKDLPDNITFWRLFRRLGRWF